ncbi:hypothetical protein, partial [Borreliella garinii]|uniref:hypothetical protein n=1 Tax=Borreliella garinii TaxID=29519 RepID=UPI001AEDEA11
LLISFLVIFSREFSSAIFLLLSLFFSLSFLRFYIAILSFLACPILLFLILSLLFSLLLIFL